MFQGIYRGKAAHPADLKQVLERAARVGISSIMCTSGTLQEFHENCDLITGIEKEYNDESMNLPRLTTTVGVHPTRCQEIAGELLANDEGRIETYWQDMSEVVQAELKKSDSKLIAIGECGLDYARIDFCPVDLQKSWFEKHFDLVNGRLPMFLHLRDAFKDFFEILKRNLDKFTCGVVHSFTGSWEEAEALINLAPGRIYIGFNGCSVREAQGIEVVKRIPLNRIMIESDAPWCELRSTHASAAYLKKEGEGEDDLKAVPKEKFRMGWPVKSRNEPSATRQVLKVIAAVKGIDESVLADIIYENTRQVFNV